MEDVSLCINDFTACLLVLNQENSRADLMRFSGLQRSTVSALAELWFSPGPRAQLGDRDLIGLKTSPNELALHPEPGKICRFGA
jgi:hypothetical protein